MKDKTKIELTEIFMAKAGKNGWDNCFHGTITRGKGIVHGRIKMGTGFIVATGKDQWELGEKLDELVLANLTLNLCDDPKPKLN